MIEPEALHELAIRRAARLRIHGDAPEPIDMILSALSTLAEKEKHSDLQQDSQIILMAEALSKILQGRGTIEGISQSVSASQFNMASKVNITFDCVTYH